MGPNDAMEGKRRYRVLDLIGRGGGGSVYRARMEGPEGFAKEVALKVVRNSEISAGEIARFRDEARILGLVRDRAIVSVEPPIRLGDRWAIVMEYVDGVSAQRLVTRGPPIPPRAAVEIVGEIARVLHKVYVQEGPDGRPLQLLHRDLKPANLQITPEGDVKLLDFGVASAKFDARESVTLHTIAGTRGYIAPERIRGVEGPEADVYSLGVMLHVLITGDKALELERHPDVPRAEEIERVLELAESMRDPNPTRRPSAQDVQRRCGAFATTVGGPTLREWAHDSVPKTAPFAPDELVGTTLTETVDITSRAARSREGAAPVVVKRGLWVPVVAVAGLAAATLGLSMVLLVALAMRGSFQPPAPIAIVEAVQIPVPVPVPTPAPVAVELPSPSPVPVVAPTPRPAPVPPPAPAVRAALAPVVPEPVAPAQEPIAMAMVTFESEPPGAVVSLDGVAVGRTPLRSLPVSHGPHVLRLEGDGTEIVRNIRVSARGSTSYRWEGDQLVAR